MSLRGHTARTHSLLYFTILKLDVSNVSIYQIHKTELTHSNLNILISYNLISRGWGLSVWPLPPYPCITGFQMRSGQAGSIV